jgi:hypothetical protein
MNAGPVQSVTVPDVTGKDSPGNRPDSGAIGLRLEAEGAGAAARQWPFPGEVVPAGTVINVEFQPPSGQEP